METYLSYAAAFDRFNYGDLLFPLILEKLQTKKNISLGKPHFWGIRKSDLTDYGCMKSSPMRDMFRLGNNTDKHYIIVCGGEVLPATWNIMYSHLLDSNISSFLFKAWKKIFGKTITDYTLRILYHHINMMPWIFDPDNFFSNTRIAYNAVGGTRFDHLNLTYKKHLIKCLKNAHYLSVRDNLTYNSLKKLNQDITCTLAPDAAITMSDFYSREFLEKNSSPELKNQLKKLQGNYICFQSSKKCALGNESIIYEQLIAIQHKTGHKIMLFPIGLASGHEDDYIIDAIQKKPENNENFIFIKDIKNIWDIMAIIAFSSGYLGTSLHGYITALSFSINRMGLHPSIIKLISFAETWDIKNALTGISYNDMGNQIMKMLSQPRDIFDELSYNLKTTYYREYDSMIDRLIS